jgi:hypothetical protein
MIELLERRKPMNAKVKKHRSPGYPATNLATAVKLARKLYPAGRHPLGIEVIAQQWGYKSVTSSASYVAALKQFGLLSEEKGGPERMLRLSEWGMDIGVDQDGRSSECRMAIEKAALHPALYAELWGKWHPPLPPDAEMRRYLERERGFNPKHVAACIDDYKSTLDFAGLISSGRMVNEQEGERQDEWLGRVPGPGDYVHWSPGGVSQFSSPRKVLGVSDDWQFAFVEGIEQGLPMAELTAQDCPTTATTTLSPTSTTPPPANPFFKPKLAEEPSPPVGVAKEQKTLDEGPAILTWPDNMSKESVEELEYWLQGVIRRAKRKAGLLPPSRTRPTLDAE